MDIEKLKVDYKKMRRLPKDIQQIQLKACLQKEGCFNGETIDILIGKLANEIDKKSFSHSISFGLSYPALLAILSMLLGAIGLLFPSSSSTMDVLIIVAGAVMLLTAIRIKTQTYIYDLIDLLYDFKLELNH